MILHLCHLAAVSVLLESGLGWSDGSLPLKRDLGHMPSLWELIQLSWERVEAIPLQKERPHGTEINHPR